MLQKLDRTWMRVPKIPHEIFVQLLKVHGVTLAAGCAFALMAQLKTYPTLSIRNGFMFFLLMLALGAVFVAAHLAQWYLMHGTRPWKVFAGMVLGVVAPFSFQFLSWPLVAVTYAIGMPLVLIALKAPEKAD